MIVKADTLRVLRETIDSKPSLGARDYLQHNIIPRFVHHLSDWRQAVLVSDGLGVALQADIENVLHDPIPYSSELMREQYLAATQRPDFKALHHLTAVVNYSPIDGFAWHLTGIPIPDVPAICWEGLVLPIDATTRFHCTVHTNKSLEGRRLRDLIESPAAGAMQ